MRCLRTKWRRMGASGGWAWGAMGVAAEERSRGAEEQRGWMQRVSAEAAGAGVVRQCSRRRRRRGRVKGAARARQGLWLWLFGAASAVQRQGRTVRGGHGTATDGRRPLPRSRIYLWKRCMALAAACILGWHHCHCHPGQALRTKSTSAPALALRCTGSALRCTARRGAATCCCH